MNTEQLYAAGMAVELPGCDACDGSRVLETEDGDGVPHECPCWVCDGTGRKGGELAIKLHNDHKAELEHHWKQYSKLDPAKSRSYDRRKRSHAAAIRRIAGYLGVE